MRFTKFLATSGLLLSSAVATALPIEGGVSFVGNPPSTFSFDLATDTVDFDDAGNNGKIAALSGDYVDDFSVGDVATFFDFSYASISSPIKIWEATTNTGDLISFTLESLEDAIEVSSSPLTSSVLLTGSGFISDGTDSIKSNWNMSLNAADGTYSWSSSTANVPEPSAILLLGLGIAGVACSRRKIRSAT